MTSVSLTTKCNLSGGSNEEQTNSQRDIACFFDLYGWPVNLLAMSTDPPSLPINYTVYSGTDSYGSLNVVQTVSSTQDTVQSTFYGQDGSAILVNLDQISHKLIVTMPGGHFKFTPNADDTYTATFHFNGQTSQVALDSAGNVLTPNGESIVETAMGAIAGSSYQTALAYQNFCLAEGLAIQSEDGSLAVNQSAVETALAASPSAPQVRLNCVMSWAALVLGSATTAISCGVSVGLGCFIGFIGLARSYVAIQYNC